MSSITERIDENHWAYEEFKHPGINCGRTIKRFIRSTITLSRKIGESIMLSVQETSKADRRKGEL